MAQSAEMIAQIVEKLGMPIIASVNEVERQKQAMGRVQGTPSDESQARLIAELLGKSTELGLMLFRSFDIKEPTETRADAARLGMTALSSTVIANLYGMTGRIPGDQELGKIEKVVQAVVAFSENFEVGHDAGQALGAADLEKSNGLPVLDFIAVHYSAALIPVVNAVAAFPFGRPEDALIQEIVQRLMGISKGFCARLYPDSNDEQRAAVEVSIMKIGANTYAQCHFAEMTQLMSSGDQQKMMAQNISMDGVWTNFDKRMGMLEVVVSSILGQNVDTSAAGSSSGPAQTAPAQAAPIDVTASPPAAAAPPQAPIDVTAPPPADVAAPAASEVQAEPAAEQPAADPSDPMAFFGGAPAENSGS